MPRPTPTHRQGESGEGTSSRGAASRGGGSRGGRGGSRGGRGFQVGPKHAGRDAYLGKAKKIKADLILRAKIKKQFAKTLKDEGLDSSRLGSGSRRAGERDDGYKGKGKAVEESEEAPAEAVPEPSRTRALSPPTPPAKESTTTSLRTIKREAFAKHHPSRVGSAPYMKAKPLQADQRGRKGQPNMGARMGALLEQIKRG